MRAHQGERDFFSRDGLLWVVLAIPCCFLLIAALVLNGPLPPLALGIRCEVYAGCGVAPAPPAHAAPGALVLHVGTGVSTQRLRLRNNSTRLPETPRRQLGHQGRLGTVPCGSRLGTTPRHPHPAQLQRAFAGVSPFLGRRAPAAGPGAISPVSAHAAWLTFQRDWSWTVA